MAGLEICRNIRNMLHQKGVYVCIPDSDEVKIDREWLDILERQNVPIQTSPLKNYHIKLDSENADMNLFTPDLTRDNFCKDIRAEFFREDSTECTLLLLSMLIETRHLNPNGIEVRTMNKFEILWLFDDDMKKSGPACYNTDMLEYSYSARRMGIITLYLVNINYGIQRFFLEKPNIFRVFHKRNSLSDMQAARTEYHSQRHSCKIRKIICLNKEEANCKKDIGSYSHYQCDRWSVSGHYRIYKSGKKIWVHPYEKGKHKNEKDYPITQKKYKK